MALSSVLSYAVELDFTLRTVNTDALQFWVPFEDFQNWRLEVNGCALKFWNPSSNFTKSTHQECIFMGSYYEMEELQLWCWKWRAMNWSKLHNQKNLKRRQHWQEAKTLNNELSWLTMTQHANWVGKRRAEHLDVHQFFGQEPQDPAT